jgi:GH15 family glucan-1,4-alpha-glucosidase
LLNYAGQLGLFSEEVGNKGAKALGNYPQAFTHIALINSAYNLKKAEMRQAEYHTDPVIAAIHLHK